MGILGGLIGGGGIGKAIGAVGGIANKLGGGESKKGGGNPLQALTQILNTVMGGGK